jgi:cytohesin
LYRAAHKGRLGTVRELLDSGVDPDARGTHGWTPLMIAVAEQHAAVARLLIERGAHPNAVNAQGRTPLMFAARYGNLELTELLLRAGADPNLRGVETEWLPLWRRRRTGMLQS